MHPAIAQGPEPLVVAGTGACPAPERVRQAIFELTSADRRALPAASRVEVADQGEAFTVEVGGADRQGRRVYADAERDCERRVRIAAVFAVTTLIPPELAPPAPAPERPRPAAPEPKLRPPPPLVPMPTLRLELGAFGEAGVHFTEPTRVLFWGGELRGALGAGAFAATFGLAYAPRAELVAPEFDAEVTRIVASFGGRLRLLERPIDLELDAAALGAFLRLRGTGLFAPADDDALELGVRVGLVLAPRRARGVLPFAGVHAACFPAPRAIAVAPAGTVAHTPLLYAGVTLGVALGL